ncbi:MAG: hypothetical protein EA388_10385 [Nitriliruptor sp.]|nr:MAG: hypothetical protein EA388_10385 [Nitriliruptor sp.]
MRRTAAVLALAVALVEIASFIASEVRLRGAMVEFGASFGAVWTRLPAAAAFWIPWMVGGVLLLLGRRYLGTAIVVPAAVLSLPTSLFSLQWIFDLGGADAEIVFADLVWVELAGSVLTVLLVVAAGVLAWLARPRVDWRIERPHRTNLYTVVAFLAWLPSVLASTQFVPVGAEGTSIGARHFVEFIWTVSGGWGAVVGIVSAILLAAMLVIAPGLRRDAAGAMALFIALPLLILAVNTLIAVRQEEFVVSTPAGWLGALGALALATIGAVWMVEGLGSSRLRERRHPDNEPGDDTGADLDLPTDTDQ